MKSMNKTKNKVFIFAISLVFFILIVQILSQKIIFQNFFLEGQKKIIEDNLLEVQSQFFNSSKTIQDFNSINRKVSIDNDISLYFDSIDKLKADIESKKDDLYIDILDENNQKQRILLTDFSFVQLYQGDLVRIKAETSSDSNSDLVARSMAINDEYIFESPYFNSSKSYTSINGEISGLSSFFEDDFYYAEDRIMEYELNYLLSSDKLLDELFEGKVIQSIKDNDPYTDLEYTLFLLPLTDLNGERLLVSYVLTYDDLNNALLIINEFSLINFIVALISCLIFSYVFSSSITNPLIAMESIAKKMSKLDFSEQVEIKGTNELKSLGKSLNLLSQKLKDSIENLTSANKKLEDDIIIINRQEEIRKNFMANASHELKTPLTIISGICEGIKDNIYGLDKIDSINEETNNMKTLVSSLLEITKNENNSLNLNSNESYEIFNLSDSFYQEINRFKTLIESNNLNLEFECDDIFVNANKEKINMVISNLISNAIKYSKPSSTIEVCIYEDQAKAVFKISNPSEYVSTEDLNKIWNPFYKLDTSGNKKSGGHGLGLSIVKGILDNHKSNYSCDYNDGIISFYFDLDSIRE